MDSADYAEIEIEQHLARAIAAARGIPETHRATHCRDCDEPLERHRRAYGVCVPCQQRRERLAACQGRSHD